MLNFVRRYPHNPQYIQSRINTLAQFSGFAKLSTQGKLLQKRLVEIGEEPYIRSDIDIDYEDRHYTIV